MMKFAQYIFLALILISCKSKQVVPAATAVEVIVPSWVSSRPNNTAVYTGIGFAEKGKGNDYSIEAKKAALFDLASEIKINISSNSVLYTVQNNNNFNENFNSLIKLSNTDNLEGYNLVQTYENDKQYWVYYELDKQKYADAKAQKKQQTINKASNLIAASFVDEKNKDFSSSLKKRIQAFGVLSPYLNEEISFDPNATQGVKTVFDLTNLIQQQLQSISVLNQNANPVLKPYQASYQPLVYKLQINNKSPLQNFPFIVTSDDDRINIEKISSTNPQGEAPIKIISVEPLNQTIGFSLSPDINTLMGSDSVGRAGVILLGQFINTGTLKAFADIRNITLFISCTEKNLGIPTGNGSIENFIKMRFSGQEIRLVENPAEADYLIEASADTKEDLSSDVLNQNYSLKLAALNINLSLKARISNETLYKTQVLDVYGYANQLDKAGLNAYESPKLNGKLAESVFFLKRKILVY